MASAALCPAGATLKTSSSTPALNLSGAPRAALRAKATPTPAPTPTPTPSSSSLSLSSPARALEPITSTPFAPSGPQRAAGVARSTNGTPAGTRSYRVTLLPGDGIGPEIMAVCVQLLQQLAALEGIEFTFTEALVGGAAIDATGVPLPDATLDTCKAGDAVLLAAIGGYKWDTLPADLRPERGLLGLRAGLGAFANLRPATVYPQLVEASTLRPEVVSGVDIMVIRELTGGIYFGKPKGFGTDENGNRTGFNTMIYSTPEIDRIARVGFEAARKRSKRLCSVDKSNVLEVSQLWRERVTAIGAEEYPDVELSHMYVDNAAMQLIRNPKQFDTIVTGNIFGDILSDEASMLTGSIGMLPSASIGSEGPGIFEPVHGSAPDIAGQDKANPLAQVLSAAMMLRYGLNEPRAADLLEEAVLYVLDAGHRTGDLASAGQTPVGCKKMGSLLSEALDKVHAKSTSGVAA